MNKKELFSDFERENELIKTLFNFSKFQEKNSAALINQILTFLQTSKNGPDYFIKLIDYYSLCRPQYPNLSKLFVQSIFFCFPETTQQNKTFIKKQTEALKNIIFPEEFQQNTTNNPMKGLKLEFLQKIEELEKKMNDLSSLIENDDDDSLDSFIKSHP